MLKASDSSAGVQQGCVLAPAVFCLAINWIRSRCSSNLGITLGEAAFTDLDYADDAVFFAEVQANGRLRFDDAAATMDLDILWKRTKLQNIGHGSPSQSVTVKFVYLLLQELVGA